MSKLYPLESNNFITSLVDQLNPPPPNPLPQVDHSFPHLHTFLQNLPQVDLPTRYNTANQPASFRSSPDESPTFVPNPFISHPLDRNYPLVSQNSLIPLPSNFEQTSYLGIVITYSDPTYKNPFPILCRFNNHFPWPGYLDNHQTNNPPGNHKTPELTPKLTGNHFDNILTTLKPHTHTVPAPPTGWLCNFISYTHDGCRYYTAWEPLFDLSLFLRFGVNRKALLNEVEQRSVVNARQLERDAYGAVAWSIIPDHILEALYNMIVGRHIFPVDI